MVQAVWLVCDAAAVQFAAAVGFRVQAPFQVQPSVAPVPVVQLVWLTFPGEVVQ